MRQSATFWQRSEHNRALCFSICKDINKGRGRPVTVIEEKVDETQYPIQTTDRPRFIAWR